MVVPETTGLQQGGRSWRQMQLGAALANCLPLPWLVGHAARVCVSGEPPSSLLSPVEEVVVVGGSHSSELRGRHAPHHCRHRHGWMLRLDSFKVVSDEGDLETMRSDEDRMAMDK